MSKKHMQLGMNPSTAQHRLVKDILWKLIVQTDNQKCCKCGELMSRETFSIEHLIPWLDSENPVELFFDLDNIGFSHLSCNMKDSRRPQKREDREQYLKEKRQKATQRARDSYIPEKRKVKYETTGH
jgi:hypothetical protein